MAPGREEDGSLSHGEILAALAEAIPASSDAVAQARAREAAQADAAMKVAIEWDPATPEQESRVGNQTGGRVFLFLHTDDFWRDFNFYKNKGVVFVREPKEEAYGTVAVFRDLYGNLWDLLQLTR